MDKFAIKDKINFISDYSNIPNIVHQIVRKYIGVALNCYMTIITFIVGINLETNLHRNLAALKITFTN